MLKVVQKLMGFILTWAEMNCDIAEHFYLPFFFKEIVKLCTNVIKNCSDCKSRQALLTEKRKASFDSDYK